MLFLFYKKMSFELHSSGTAWPIKKVSVEKSERNQIKNLVSAQYHYSLE